MEEARNFPMALFNKVSEDSQECGRAASLWHLGQSRVLIKTLSAHQAMSGFVDTCRHSYTRRTRETLGLEQFHNYTCRKMSGDSATPYRRATECPREAVESYNLRHKNNRVICFSNVTEKVRPYERAKDTRLIALRCDRNANSSRQASIRNELHRRPGSL